jgi:hypothetical protein
MQIAFTLSMLNFRPEVHNSPLNAVLHEKPEIERADSTGKV